MSRAIRMAALAALSAAALAGAAPAAAQFPGPPLGPLFPCSPQFAVTQTFTSPNHQTSWALCWRDGHTRGLIISRAYFKKSATAPWVQVLGDLRLADIFVPYHDNSARYHDLQWGWMNRLDAQECPPPQGTLLGQYPPPQGPEPTPHVCKEVRDRGLAWRDVSGGRRGRELVLWSSYDTGNYKFIMEYGFRDDGVVTARLGSTGLNSPANPWMPHMHNALFRVDVDLGGALNDRVEMHTHAETGLTASDSHTPVLFEQGIVWNATAFTSVLVEDAVITNARGHNSGYMLVPLRTGTARHAEPATHNDIWVTRYRPTELGGDLPLYIQDPTGVLKHEGTQNVDVVLWYWGSAHHHPRDEDGDVAPSPIDFAGVAQIMWSGFMLIPRNLLDGPPHWP